MSSKLAEKAIAHFRPLEGCGPHAVWHTLIYCDLNIEKNVSAKDAAAATRIRKRAQKMIKHVIENTKGMSEPEIASWFSAYIDERARAHREAQSG